jgi:hydroxymethylbilane synthase
VESGQLDATVLASAGLRRLGMTDRISALLPLEKFPPACGQGTIAIECRKDDADIQGLLQALDHRETAASLACERAFLAALGGSCKTPVAGYARIHAGELRFDGVVLSADGRESYEARGVGPVADAALIGAAAGEDILRRAPADFLKRLGIG